MIPAFNATTGALPPGIHSATWTEVITRFGYNAQRATLLLGLGFALEALRQAGCRRVYLGGSFVTNKAFPNDFDACWDLAGTDFDALHPIFGMLDDDRLAQKRIFGGELFPAHFIADVAGTSYLEYLQRDKAGHPVGIIKLDLGEAT